MTFEFLCVTMGFNRGWGGAPLVPQWGALFGCASAVYVVPTLFFTKLRWSIPLVYLGTLVVGCVFVDQWIGAAIPAGIAQGFLCLASLMFLRIAKKNPALGCIQCGYDLKGLPTRVCPECGTEQSRTRDAAADWS